MVLVLVGCDDGKAERADRIQKAKEITKHCNQNPYAYLQINDYLFKVPRKGLYVSYQHETVNAGCFTTELNPVEVDFISLSTRVKIPDYENDYNIQFFVAPYSETDKNMYEQIQDLLKTENKRIEDLPRVGAFYKYTKSEKFNSAHYISADKKFVDSQGIPIVVADCMEVLKILECGVSFNWKSDIGVSVREIGNRKENLPDPESMDAWLDIYPLYLETLNTILIDISEGNQQ